MSANLRNKPPVPVYLKLSNECPTSELSSPVCLGLVVGRKKQRLGDFRVAKANVPIQGPAPSSKSAREGPRGQRTLWYQAYHLYTGRQPASL